MDVPILRASQLIQHGRHAEAEATLRESLNADINDYHAWIMLVRALHGQEKWRQAEDAARRAISLEPELDSGHFLLALVLVSASRGKEAQKAVEEAIRLCPEDSANHGLLARIHWEESRYRDALESALKGLKFDPECDMCRFYLGLAQSRLGETRAADATLTGLLAANPEDAENHVARGFMLLDSRDHEGARRHFLEALRLDSSHTGAKEGLSLALKARNPVFAFFLRFDLLASRWGWKGPVAVVVLLILSTRLLRWGKDIPWVGPVCLVLLATVWVFAICTMATGPIFTLLLLLQRDARHVVQPREKAAALWCAPLLIITLWFVVSSIIRDPSSSPVMAFLTVALTQVVWESFASSNAWVRKRMRILAVTCVILAGAMWGLIQYKAGPLKAQIEKAIPDMDRLSTVEKVKRLKDSDFQERFNELLHLIRWTYQAQLGLLIICLFAENIRQFLERRAPDPA